MWHKTIERKHETIHEMYQSWYDVLWEGIVGPIYIVVGLMVIVATPFLVVKALVDQYVFKTGRLISHAGHRHGGFRDSEDTSGVT